MFLMEYLARIFALVHRGLCLKRHVSSEFGMILWANTRKYRALLKSLGLDTWESETPAVPIVLGSKERVYPFWKALLEKGVFTVMSIAPAVPAGKDLIRTAVSAMHTDEQFDRIADALSYAVKRL
jgi:7-keto-8-aminopelargonate synthetase-like enzyme